MYNMNFVSSKSNISRLNKHIINSFSNKEFSEYINKLIHIINKNINIDIMLYKSLRMTLYTYNN